MARLHLKFKNIHRKTREAGETLFKSKPWSGNEEEQQGKFERFLREASAVYSVPQPTLAIIPDLDVYGYVAPNTIVLDKYSVISLFNSFRLHLQYMGTVDAPFPSRNDAQSWACSLFYTLRPIQFRKMVREGRIVSVRAHDLLTSATLAARQDEVDEAFAGLIAESFGGSEVDDLEDEAADGMDEDEATPAVPNEAVGTFRNPNVVTTANYGVRAAAEMLGVSQSTVRNMLRDGRLTEVREGRNVAVTGESLARIVPANEVAE